MPVSAGSTNLRAIALAAILGNVAFNYLYAHLGWGPAMDVASARYETAFTPAGYAFAIWGVIYTAFIAYGVQSLRLAQRREPAYDALALPLVAANLLGTAWILAYTRDYLGTAVILIVASTVVGGIMLARAARYAPARNSRWLRVPFGLYFGWITVAAIACIAQWLQARGWVGRGDGETIVTVAFLALAAAAGFVVAERYREPLYPAVIAWASFAVFVAQRDTGAVIAWAALATALVMVAWAALALRAADAEARLRQSTIGVSMLARTD